MTIDNVRVLLMVGAALAALAGVVGLLALWWHARATGFGPTLRSNGDIIASDTGVVPPMMLRDPVLGIRGRPDYVVEEGPPGAKRLVPVEVKPTRRSPRLYESDEVQMGAYLIALRATFGGRASNTGVVRYLAESFRVELTPRLGERVRHLVDAIRRDRAATMVHRSHTASARCASCSIRSHCDESL